MGHNRVKQAETIFNRPSLVGFEYDVNKVFLQSLNTSTIPVALTDYVEEGF